MAVFVARIYRQIMLKDTRFPLYLGLPALRPLGCTSCIQNRSRRFCRGNDVVFKDAGCLSPILTLGNDIEIQRNPERLPGDDARVFADEAGRQAMLLVEITPPGALVHGQVIELQVDAKIIGV